MHPDQWLPRIVAIGLFGLAIMAIVLYTQLRLAGHEAAELIALASAGVGALAGFFTGVRFPSGGGSE